jgi:3-hydroxy acid dehydrogenase/malonic semialdehyde reductase
MKKTIIITGASSGFGEAMARHFSNLGFSLALGARRINKLKKLESELGKNVWVHELDVTNQDSVTKFVSACMEKFVFVDALINNAGLALGLDRIEAFKEEDWKTMWETNVLGVARMTHAVEPHLKAGSRIINIGSISSYETYEGGAAYCSSKHALRAVTQTMRYELMEKGILVSTIDPGMAETEFSMIRFKQDSARAKKVYEGLKPLTADDIAEVAAFILSRPSHVSIDEILVVPQAQTLGKKWIQPVIGQGRRPA